jgi:hypothetical protein
MSEFRGTDSLEIMDLATPFVCNSSQEIATARGAYSLKKNMPHCHKYTHMCAIFAFPPFLTNSLKVCDKLYPSLNTQSKSAVRECGSELRQEDPDQPGCTVRPCLKQNKTSKKEHDVSLPAAFPGLDR